MLTIFDLPFHFMVAIKYISSLH